MDKQIAGERKGKMVHGRSERGSNEAGAIDDGEILSRRSPTWRREAEEIVPLADH